MKLRRFNEAGINQFEDYLDALNGDPSAAVPEGLLREPKWSREVKPAVEVDEHAVFEDKLAAAEHLHSAFDIAGLVDVDADKGLWSWISLLYIDQVCPSDRHGNRRPGARARLVPETDYNRYYRHLFAGPYMVYRSHADAPEKAHLLLCGPLNQQGDIFEQLASRQELVSNPAIMQVASALYFDPEGRKPKRGAASRAAPGNPRRLNAFLQQLDVNWDLYSIEPERLTALLPDEFSRFLGDELA